MSPSDPHAEFERIVMPHLDAAYNLARWLAGNDHDAEDIAQEACLRAFRFIGGYRGGNSRSWLLTIVRNTAFTWLKRNRPNALVPVTDEEWLAIEAPGATPNQSSVTPHLDLEVLRAAIEQLPVEFREVLILREIEDLSYKEISEVADAPIGTVMSRLARARKQLQDYLVRKGAE